MDREPTDIQRVGIILENMRSDFRAVIEKVEDSDRRNEERLNEFKEEVREEFSLLKRAVTTTSKAVNKLETKFDKLEVKVDNLEVKVDNIQADVSEIKFDIQLMREGFSDHEHRIKKLEMA